LKKQQDNKVELMLELLGLKESEHTKVGNAMTRGVSGGSDLHFIYTIAAYTAHALFVRRTVADVCVPLCCCCCCCCFASSVKRSASRSVR
jgi:hypothetical protein